MIYLNRLYFFDLKRDYVEALLLGSHSIYRHIWP